MIIIASIAIVALVVLEYIHFLERKSLLDRIMAKNIHEYQYYQKEFEKDVEAKHELVQDSMRTFPGIDGEIRAAAETPIPIDYSEFEEDWSEPEESRG